MSALLESEYTRHEPLSDNDIDAVEKIDHTIYRFKFTEEFMEELYKFAKIHQYDHRKDFKEAWIKWTDENSDIISNETERLLALGYKNEDNINDKMFKSARYYFRKKSPVKPEPKQRRQYISVDQELLLAIDQHIIVNNECKPETAFIMFCKENEDVLRQSIQQILHHFSFNMPLSGAEMTELEPLLCASSMRKGVIKGVNETQLIQAKIKKTYKNRYFLLVNNKTI